MKKSKSEMSTARKYVGLAFQLAARTLGTATQVLLKPTLEGLQKPCKRDGCEVIHAHHNDFCCAEHCREAYAQRPKGNGKQPSVVLSKPQKRWLNGNKLPGGQLDFMGAFNIGVLTGRERIAL